MTLLAIESDQEHDCIATNIFKGRKTPTTLSVLIKLIFSGQFGNYYTDVTRLDFWTSGTDLGVEGKFWWCQPQRGSSQPLVAGAKLKWAATQPNNANGNKNCVLANNVVVADNIQLFDADCGAAHYYICEVTPAPTK